MVRQLLERAETAGGEDWIRRCLALPAGQYVEDRGGRSESELSSVHTRQWKRRSFRWKKFRGMRDRKASSGNKRRGGERAKGSASRGGASVRPCL